jgi:hypothetical protein
MFESVFSTAAGSAETTITAGNLLIALLAALALGVAQSLVYMKTHKNKAPSQSFALTLVMIPAIITVIVLLVGSNIARAFSLAGVFAIIRFRSAPGDPKDIAYVLFSTAIGLACGMGYLAYGVIVSAVLCAVMLTLEQIRFGQSKNRSKTLKITIPENLNYQDAFADILKKYTTSYELTRIRTTDLGSLFVLVYAITAPESLNEKELIDALRVRNGNLSITLVLAAAQNDGGEF